MNASALIVLLMFVFSRAGKPRRRFFVHRVVQHQTLQPYHSPSRQSVRDLPRPAWSCTTKDRTSGRYLSVSCRTVCCKLFVGIMFIKNPVLSERREVN